MSKVQDARLQAQAATQAPGINESGGQAMTPAQAQRLTVLCKMAEEPFDGSLSEADAAVRIDQLQERMSDG